MFVNQCLKTSIFFFCSFLRVFVPLFFLHTLTESSFFTIPYFSVTCVSSWEIFFFFFFVDDFLLVSADDQSDRNSLGEKLFYLFFFFFFFGIILIFQLVPHCFIYCFIKIQTDDFFRCSFIALIRHRFQGQGFKISYWSRCLTTNTEQWQWTETVHIFLNIQPWIWVFYLFEVQIQGRYSLIWGEWFSLMLICFLTNFVRTFDFST